MRGQVLIEIRDPIGGNPPDHQVLIDRGAKIPVGVPFSQIRDKQQLLGSDIAHKELDCCRHIPILLLPDDVGPPPHVKWGLVADRMGSVSVPVSVGCPVASRHDECRGGVLIGQ